MRSSHSAHTLTHTQGLSGEPESAQPTTTSAVDDNLSNFPASPQKTSSPSGDSHSQPQMPSTDASPSQQPTDSRTPSSASSSSSSSSIEDTAAQINEAPHTHTAPPTPTPTPTPTPKTALTPAPTAFSKGQVPVRISAKSPVPQRSQPGAPPSYDQFMR